MSKKEIITVHTAALASGQGVRAGSQGKTFEDGGLKKEAQMGKEKRYWIMKNQKIGIILYIYFC